ncbi:SIR2 family protein [Microbulbifer sp.]|uniref:SIR2 family protein n=1 Tax=Microbulbifer sp. TaxID=1908541 RepID=UPI00258FA312|nr:SIR2 family protein [Microbulbifer sp.]
MKGIFLGAGASYEVGMPLVWEFSQTLRENVLKRLDSKLFNFESGGELKSFFIEILSDEKLHYEQVVGLLEKRYIEDRTNSQRIHGVIVQLIECIQLLLLEEQSNTLKFLSEKIKDYYGIRSLINREGVINIFSLNHDIVFEEVLDYYKIPYKDGFYKRDNNYSHIAKFKVATSSELASGDLDFFNSNEHGANLIKLHGSLDVFAAEDKNLFLKSYGESSFVGSNYAEIRKIEDRNLEILQRDGVRATNELYANDRSGELQFLRRSLLSGAHKFKGQFDQIIPVSLLEFFTQQLKATDHLTVIGYSFGDEHINVVLEKWLECKSKTIEIYDPYRSNIPDGFSDHKDQFTLIKGGLTDYFLTFDSTQESWITKSKRAMFNTVRDSLKSRRLRKKN